MFTERLLHVAELLCGPHARATIFEPLIADCQREWFDASNGRRPIVAAAGVAAFAWTLLRTIEPSSAFIRRPLSAFAVAVIAFAIAGTIVALQPLNFRWLGAGIDIAWRTPPPRLGYFVPNALAQTLAFALLPVMLLAALARWRRLKALAAFAVAVTVILTLEGWIAPAAMYARNREFIAGLPEPHRTSSIRRYANTLEVLSLARSNNRTLAFEAQLELKRKAELLTRTTAFALLGWALGYARQRAGRRAGVMALIGWWLGAWFACHALQYWSLSLVVLWSLPPALSLWLAPFFFGMLATAAMINAGTGGTGTRAVGANGY